MRLLIGIEVTGYAEKQLPQLEEIVNVFVRQLPHRISIGDAHLEIFKEVKGELSEPKSKPNKTQRVLKQQKGP